MTRKMRDAVLAVLTILALSALSGCIVRIDAAGWDGQAYQLHEGDGGPWHDGSGVEATERREVELFDSIDMRGPVDLVVRIGTPQRVEVVGDDNLVGRCLTTVDDGRLKVRMERGSYRFTRGISVAVTVPALEAIRVAASSDVAIHDYSGADLRLAVSGSGDISASGTVDRLRAVVSGSGDLDLADLVARTATVSVSGSGDVHVHATESLDAVISGSGDVRYGGRPVTSLQITGSGTIRPRD
jgi:hypothetical protein